MQDRPVRNTSHDVRVTGQWRHVVRSSGAGADRVGAGRRTCPGPVRRVRLASFELARRSRRAQIISLRCEAAGGRPPVSCFSVVF